MDSAPVPPKYQLLAELGHGGMADVYLAVLKGPTDFTKLAVVKRLRSHLAEDPEFLAMFLQEARIAARLNHPNVVHTFEVGHDGKHHFIAMEYLQGHAFSAILSRVGRDQLDFAIQLRIIIETLEGLQYAHDLRDFDGSPLGLVHRDVSPQNIFVTYDGQIKILDFGIAKALDSAVETRTGVIKGKLSYMSPEQALAGDVDRRSDIYSIGVILWEAVAGKRRWKGLSNVSMMKKLVSADEPLELPDPLVRSLPAELTGILERALARDPDVRYAQASELQADLERVLDQIGRPLGARDVGKFVAETFAEDRQRVLGVIDTELKKLDARDTPTHRPGRDARASIDLPPLDLPPNSISSSNTMESPGATEQSAALSIPEVKLAARRSRWAYVAAGSAVVLAAAAYAVTQTQSVRSQSGTSAEVASPEVRVVKIVVSASPKKAELYLDDQRLGGNPHIAEVPREEREVKVRAELAGYEPQERTLWLNRDAELHIELEKLEEEPPPASASASAEPKSKPARWRPPPRIAKSKTPSKPDEKPEVPTSAPTEPVAKPPPKKPSTGVVLDTENPWEKK